MEEAEEEEGMVERGRPLVNVVGLEMGSGASSRARIRERLWPGEDMVMKASPADSSCLFAESDNEMR